MALDQDVAVVGWVPHLYAGFVEADDHFLHELFPTPEAVCVCLNDQVSGRGAAAGKRRLGRRRR